MIRLMNRILPILIYSHTLKVKNGVRRKRHNACWTSISQRNRTVFPGMMTQEQCPHGLSST